jgi:cytochrome P450
MTVGTVSASVFDAALPTLSYDDTEAPAEIYPRIQAAQELAPIALGPHGPEVLSYHLVRSVLRDTRFQVLPGKLQRMPADAAKAAFQKMSVSTRSGFAAQDTDSGPLWDKTVDSLICLTGEEHHRLRSLLFKAFTPRATARLHDTMVDVINELVDRVAEAGRCDVVADIARPYPVPIICAFLGAPREDWQQFSLWADDISKAFSFTSDLAVDESGIMRVWRELADYVDDMVARLRRDLTDDLLSDLIRAEDNGDRLNAAQLRMLAVTLLLTGTDTIRSQLAASVQALCEHHEQWDLLKQQPELAMRAVEETMRHSPTVCKTLRCVVEDVELGGYVFPAHTMILVNTAAASRDPAVYDDPDRVDITREEGPRILTFGGGVHYCLGANLARLELAEALKILARRMLNSRTAGPAPWRPMASLSGPKSLPIEFDTGR